MVHVLDLLGCTVSGRTTQEAVALTPGAFQRFRNTISFPEESSPASKDIEWTIAEHVMEGDWLGYGDPTPGFSPDYDALGQNEFFDLVDRLVILHSAILDLLTDLPSIGITAKPTTGRSVLEICRHLVESEKVYLQYWIGKVGELNEPLRIIQQEQEGLIANLSDFWTEYHKRLKQVHVTELQMIVPHGKVVWTARRAIRRMLEHSWEHLEEMNHRIKCNPLFTE
jgi:hypothetical protein